MIANLSRRVLVALVASALACGAFAAPGLVSGASATTPTTTVSTQHEAAHHGGKHHKVKHHKVKHHKVKHHKVKHTAKQGRAAQRSAAKAKAAKATRTVLAHADAAPEPTALTAALGRTWATTMLTLLNVERAAHLLKPLKMNAKLITSAHRHNLTMAAANSMSHQLPHEPNFAVRISRAGYDWQAAGENIGFNCVQTVAGLLELQTMMYNEKAPDDGHRVNILNSSYREVGIDVYFDAAHHTMWFTQDFGLAA